MTAGLLIVLLRITGLRPHKRSAVSLRLLQILRITRVVGLKSDRLLQARGGHKANLHYRRRVPFACPALAAAKSAWARAGSVAASPPPGVSRIEGVLGNRSAASVIFSRAIEFFAVAHRFARAGHELAAFGDFLPGRLKGAGNRRRGRGGCRRCGSRHHRILSPQQECRELAKARVVATGRLRFKFIQKSPI